MRTLRACSSARQLYPRADRHSTPPCSVSRTAVSTMCSPVFQYRFKSSGRSGASIGSNSLPFWPPLAVEKGSSCRWIETLGGGVVAPPPAVAEAVASRPASIRPVTDSAWLLLVARMKNSLPATSECPRNKWRTAISCRAGSFSFAKVSPRREPAAQIVRRLPCEHSNSIASSTLVLPLLFVPTNRFTRPRSRISNCSKQRKFRIERVLNMAQSRLDDVTCNLP